MFHFLRFVILPINPPGSPTELVIDMSVSQSPGSTICRTPSFKEFHRPIEIPGRDDDCSSHTFQDRVTPYMLNSFTEKFGLTGIEIYPEEIVELMMLEQFLDRHVQVDEARRIQCMLLWSEWVREFRRQMPGFPRLIREKEFCSVITERFGTWTDHSGPMGKVYPGIMFIQ
jgi:hypothetical protein